MIDKLKELQGDLANLRTIIQRGQIDIALFECRNIQTSLETLINDFEAQDGYEGLDDEFEDDYQDECAGCY